MITQGAWQQPRSTGYFTTVWRHERNGSYKWVFDHGDSTIEPIDAPEMISAKVSQCPKTPPGYRPSPANLAPFNPLSRAGRSDDGTLIWDVTAQPDGSHNFSAEMLVDDAMTQIVIEEVSGPEG